MLRKALSDAPPTFFIITDSPGLYNVSHNSSSMSMSEIKNHALYYLFFSNPAVFIQCPDKYLLTKQVTRKIQSITMAIHTPMAP